jgi:hypothetical protein
MLAGAGRYGKASHEISIPAIADELELNGKIGKTAAGLQRQPGTTKMIVSMPQAARVL